MTKHDEYQEDIIKCIITQEECWYGDCADCDIAKDHEAEYTAKHIEEVCEFRQHGNRSVNILNTLTRDTTVDNIFRQYKQSEFNARDYKHMSYVDIAMIVKYWPHLCMVMSEYHQYRPPLSYLYRGKDWPLVAVYRDVVYMAAPKLV